jgi:hypothetical protein
MTCCSTNITRFLLATTTTINFTGQKPTVSVIYLQPDGSFLVAGVFTQINVIGNQVVVDHGGVASGYVKLIQ